MIFKALVLAVFGIISVHAACDRELVRALEWIGGPYSWPCPATKAIYASSDRYNNKNIIATRLQIYKDDAIVALPRYKTGVAATLAKVSLKTRGSEPELVPFPCWSSQEEGNCQALQSVVDLVADQQDVLWVLDTGVVNTLDCPLRRCRPKVVAYCLKTGKLLKTLDLSGLVVQASRLQYLLVEYTPSGHPFVYVSDAATRSILVFDIVGNKGYRVVLPKAVLAGLCRRDVLYISLVRKGCENFIVFTYLSSSRVFSIRTDYLRTGATQGKVVDLGLKPHKLIILGTDNGAAIFFRFEGQQVVYRWDVNKPFKQENFVEVYKSSSCLLATQVAADLKRHRIRVLESNFPDYIKNTVGCGTLQKIALLGGTC